MSRKRSKKPRIAPGQEAITVTKKSAAISQLETAIWLWFNYGDPLSILALASNANDCYDALGAHSGRPSLFKEWLKTQSPTFRSRGAYVYEFIRHGRKDLKGKTPYAPIQGEILMLDSIDCHKHLFDGVTPIMSSFNVRFMFEHPSVAWPENRAFFLQTGNVNKIRDIPRPEFLEIALKKSSKRPPSTSGELECWGGFPFGTLPGIEIP